MKKPLVFSLFQFLLSFFILFTSCNGQERANVPQNNISQTKPSESNLPDVDPYFVESQTVTTPYGPKSITRNILQDKKGDIWLATWEGIIRYDGENFTNFTNREGLRRFHVFSVLENRKGDIWFGTIGAGVYHYDGKSFTNFTTKEGLVHNRVTCIYEDKTGNIWFGTEGGASCYNGKSFHNFTTKDGLINNDINSILEDKTGRFWFGTRGNACFYDGKFFTEMTNEQGLAFGNVRSIIEDEKGNIWLGGNDGLWRFDGSSFSKHAMNFVGYIYEDRKGDIWTSSASNGNANDWTLSRYDEKSLSSRRITSTQIKAEEGMFFGILEDQEEGIWLGTLNGVCRYDGNTFNYF